MKLRDGYLDIIIDNAVIGPPGAGQAYVTYQWERGMVVDAGRSRYVVGTTIQLPYDKQDWEEVQE